jgi:hypothetical protein
VTIKIGCTEITVPEFIVSELAKKKNRKHFDNFLWVRAEERESRLSGDYGAYPSPAQPAFLLKLKKPPPMAVVMY